MMAESWPTSRLAPPIRPPSTSGMDKSSAALLGFIEPPYRMETERAHRAPNQGLRHSRQARPPSRAGAAVAVLPVPMAQMGS